VRDATLDGDYIGEMKARIPVHDLESLVRMRDTVWIRT